MGKLFSSLSPTNKSIAANTLAQLLGKIIGSGSTFVITVIAAQALGVTGYGDLVKITTFTAFFYLLADFGINAVFLQKETRWENLVALRVVLSILLIAASLAILAVFPRGVDQGYTTLVRFGVLLFAPTILFQALTTSANAIFQKYLRYEQATIAVAVGSLVSLIAAFVVVQNNPNALLLVAGLLAGSAATAVVGLLLARSIERPSDLTKEVVPQALSLFGSSIPLGVTLLFNLVYIRIDSIILTLTRTTAEVGLYGLAYKVFELPLVLPTFFMNAVYPLMIGKSSRELRVTLWRSGLFLLCTSIAIVGLLWVGAPLLSLIKGGFAASVPALRTLSISLPIFFLTSLMMWTLIALKKQRALVVIYGISMLINISLNMLFTPTHGYMAAAWITVASEVVVLLLSSVILLQALRQ